MKQCCALESWYCDYRFIPNAVIKITQTDIGSVIHAIYERTVSVFFFPTAIFAYCVSQKINQTLSKFFLTVISLFFYGWACFDDIFKLIFFILYVYFLGLIFQLMHHYKEDVQSRKAYIYKIVGFSIGSIVLFLFYYKYFNFSIGIINVLPGIELPGHSLIAPLGISYLVFSAISYLMDIYRGDVKSATLLDTALYISFFPKIASGPILLYKDFDYPSQTASLNVDTLSSGLSRFLIGFSKKTLLADYFGTVIVSMSSSQMDSQTALLSILVYGFQLYLDFDGYTDMAIGLGKMFGIALPENFNAPYRSTSITEFWRRWHISLGRFFREYLYIPLGGNRKGKTRTLINLSIVFIVTGIWHGAGFGYLIWGCLHGVCSLVERILKGKPCYEKVPSFIKWLFTMAVVFFGWQFFRYGGAGGVLELLRMILLPEAAETLTFTWQYYLTQKLVILLLVAVVLSTGIHRPIINNLSRMSPAVFYTMGWICLLMLFAVSLCISVSTGYQPFIYFQY